MKKIITTFVIAIIFIPSFSYSATITELEAQHIQLLEQIIVLLEVKIEQLIELKRMTTSVGTAVIGNTHTLRTAGVDIERR